MSTVLHYRHLLIFTICVLNLISLQWNGIITMEYIKLPKNISSILDPIIAKLILTSFYVCSAFCFGM